MFDVCVVGGGMVGSTTAVGLANMGCSVVLLENKLPETFNAEQKPDLRVSAINGSSQNLLTALGAWQSITQMRLCPFDTMAVWEKEEAKTVFSADEIGAPCLGHIVENRLIQLALLDIANSLPNLTVIEGASVSKIHSADTVTLDLENSDSISCSLLVAADGGASKTRQQLNIGTQGWQYQQHAMGINIRMMDGQQSSTTWQQFRPQGPLAFLPLYDGYASLVWYDSAQKIASLKQLNRAKLKGSIQANFPAQLGDFEILDSASFPLTRMHANQYVLGNAVLVGDSAHTINPLAGQGVNLGFKDVAALLDCLKDWDKSTTHLAERLAHYEKQRRGQNALMMTTMDGLYAAFSNDIGPIKLLRNLGLKVADKAGPLKKHVIKYAMGIE